MGTTVLVTAIGKLPRRRPELFLGPQNEQGKFVLKNRRTDEYYLIGRVEHFLLHQLDGQQNAEEVCRRFETEFGEALSAADLDAFVGLAAQQDWLELGSTDPPTANLPEQSQAPL